jgi:hypothetical protein
VAANPKQNEGHPEPFHPLADTFRMVGETRRQAQEIAETARNAIKSFYSDPVQLADFIESRHTPVYILPAGVLPAFCLWACGFSPGFIPPAENRRYKVLLGFLKLQAEMPLQKQQGRKTGCHFNHGVFVLTRPLFTVGFISHQLHHWLAFCSGMTGYNTRAQELYKKFWEENNGSIGHEIYDMKAEDILALKAAINRDLEALEFLRKIAREILIPARQSRYFSDQRHTSA